MREGGVFSCGIGGCVLLFGRYGCGWQINVLLIWLGVASCCREWRTELRRWRVGETSEVLRLIARCL